MNNDLTKMIAEQLGFLMLTNIEQSGIITKLKEQVAKLEDEKKAFQESNKYD